MVNIFYYYLLLQVKQLFTGKKKMAPSPASSVSDGRKTKVSEERYSIELNEAREPKVGIYVTPFYHQLIMSNTKILSYLNRQIEIKLVAKSLIWCLQCPRTLTGLACTISSCCSQIP